MTESKRVSIGNRVIITQRGKKKIWTAEFWNDGQHRRKSLKTSNKKIAIDRAMKIEHELLEGTFHKADSEIKLETAIENYLDHLKTEGRARKTIVRYRGELYALRDFQRSKKKKLLRQISPILFDQFREIRKRDHTLLTLYHEGTVCKTFLYWCVSRELLKQSPLKDYKLVKPPRRVKPSPHIEEILKVLDASLEPQKVLLATLAFTGMRSGELRTLRQEDVDLENNWIYLKSREGAERTKTGESRKIPIHAKLLPFLKKQPPSSSLWYFNAQASRKYPAGEHWIDPKKLNERFQIIAEKIGLPVGRKSDGYTLHSLRHFFETHCVNSRVPQRVVDTWMGHQSDKSMAAVYYQLSDKDSQSFMAELSFDLPRHKE